MVLSTSTELVRRDSIEELVGHRDRALELFRKIAELTIEARDAVGKSAPSAGVYLDGNAFRDLSSCNDERDISRFIGIMRQTVDRGVWNHCLQATQLSTLMDAKAREQFRDGLNKDCPEATVDNVAATMFSLLGDSKMIFQRGVVTAFQGLARSAKDYKRNDVFKIAERCARPYAFRVTDGGTWSSWSFSTYAEDELFDLERVFHVLDGKPVPDREASIVGAIKTACYSRESPKPTEAENDYVHCRWYKNGSLHLRFKRLDLLKRVNQIIAEHFGETIASETDTARRRTAA